MIFPVDVARTALLARLRLSIPALADDDDGALIWLICLLFYPVPWLFKAASTIEVAWSLGGLALFVICYAASLKSRDLRLLVAATLTLLIAYGVAWTAANWTILVVYAAAMFGRLRDIRSAVGGMIVGCMGAAAVGILLGQPWFWWAPGLVLSIIIGVAATRSMKLQMENEELIAGQDSLRQESTLLERERITGDLHDLLGRSLTAISVKADLALRLTERSPDEAKSEIEEIASIARESMTEVRRFLANQGSVSLARELIQSEQLLVAASIKPTVSGHSTHVERLVGMHLAMILREIVTNVVRHSHARSCTILVAFDDTGYLLCVEDDGIGGIPEEGFGLIGIRKRLNMLGGSLAITSEGRGLSLVATIPRNLK